MISNWKLLSKLSVERKMMKKNKRKKNDANFPKDLGNNRNEQNEIQL